MLNQLESFVNKSLSFLDNTYAKNIIKMLLVLYAGLAAPRLPSFLASLFNNALFRIVILFLIAYLGLKDTTIALLSAVAFTLSIIFLKKAETTNSIYGALQAAVDTPQEWINDIVDDTQKVIDDAVDTVQSGLGIDGSEISGAIDSAQAGFDSVVDGAQKGFNSLVDGIQGIIPGGDAAPVAAAVEDASEPYDAPATEEATPASIGGYDGGSFGAAL
jgi:hypothetical protein